MTKKERRELRNIKNSITWLQLEEHKKREFVKNFILNHRDLRKKDKELIIYELLGVKVWQMKTETGWYVQKAVKGVIH